MAQLINTAITTDKIVFADSSKIPPSFLISISATATVLVYQGDKDDQELVGTITESGVYNQAAVMDYFALEVSANSGTVTISIPDIR